MVSIRDGGRGETQDGATSELGETHGNALQGSTYTYTMRRNARVGVTRRRLEPMTQTSHSLVTGLSFEK